MISNPDMEEEDGNAVSQYTCILFHISKKMANTS